MTHPLHIIGLTPGSLEPSSSVLPIIGQADVLSGGRRLLDAFPGHRGQKLAFISPVTKYAEELDRLLRAGKKVVLLADGDPLFFGIAEKLVELLGQNRVAIIPAPSTLQIAAARLGLSWHKIEAVSLHGRNNYTPLFSALQQGKHCAVYTDRQNTPASIARSISKKGIDNYSMTVLSELNTDAEKIICNDPDYFTEYNGSEMNLVLLSPKEDTKKNQHLGRDDNLFQRQKGLITKFPVRATGIALLDLREGQTVWDLGAGCGSVAIEASFVADNSRFFAVEKDSTRTAMIEENIRRFKAWTVEAVHGTMPGVLEDLPTPDRIFMGGGIGHGDSVINNAAQRLTPGGRIVIHTILIGSFQRCRDTFESLGWNWQSMQLQASISEPLAGDIRYKAHNPVTIIWADKPQG